MTVQLPSRLSWSAVSSYAECGERFRLERLYKVKRHTWFATIAGKAIHEITEKYDRMVYDGFDHEDAEMLLQDFKAVFDRTLADPEECDPDLGAKPSGKVAKAYTEYGGPSKKDYDWWLHYGPEYVQRYLRWRRAQADDWEIATLPDGRPGIEVEWNVEIAGIRVQGFVDRVFYSRLADSLIVVDLKTGQEPSGKLQLVTYRVALLKALGLDIRWGCYWTPSVPRGTEFGSPEAMGKCSALTSMVEWSAPQLEAMYAAALRGIRAGVFIPQVTGMCGSCVVRQHCWAVGGDGRAEIPIYDEIVDRGTGEVVFSGASV